jgi:enoyl-CoA hydratase/carnithine racemase
MSDIVLFEELVCEDGSKLGLATLNTPKTLNGLSLDMNRLLADQFEVWAADEDVVAILMRGAGDKAFCAGGDLHSLYHAMTEQPEQSATVQGYPGTFFSEEYTFDYRIHTFPKPIIVWGDGIVMGGGLGLMMGASHRVVTETSRLAFPEITIGLFPDVGGTWLLNRLPGKTGLFLGLTGAQINAADALYAGMADYHLPRSTWDSMIAQLKTQPWSRSTSEQAGSANSKLAARVCNDSLIHQVLDQLGSEPAPTIGSLQQHAPLIQKLSSGSDLNAIVKNLLALSDNPDPWLQRAAKTLSAGSPGSARLTFELLKRIKHVSLADAFRIEFVAGMGCAVHGDFAEGIRALLVDKDKQPRWNPATLEQATAEWVSKFFRAPYSPEQDPLRALGT